MPTYETSNGPLSGAFAHVDYAIVALAEALMADGNICSPRDQEIRELTDVRIFLPNAVDGICTLAKRKVSYKLMIAEALMYFAGWGDKPEQAELLCMIAPSYSKYLNQETNLFDGAYGPRAYHALEAAYELLKRDPDTRQAVVPIYRVMDVEAASVGGSLDIPCTCLWQFRIRKGHLEMTVYMRSNDLFWGTPHDIGAFTLVQRMLAAALGVPPGSYTHFANSLHYYTSIEQDFRDQHSSHEVAETIPIPLSPGMHDLAGMRKMCVEVLEHALAFNVQTSVGDRMTAKRYLLSIDKIYEDDPVGGALWRGITGRFKAKT